MPRLPSARSRSTFIEKDTCLQKKLYIITHHLVAPRDIISDFSCSHWVFCIFHQQNVSHGGCKRSSINTPPAALKPHPPWKNFFCTSDWVDESSPAGHCNIPSIYWRPCGGTHPINLFLSIKWVCLSLFMCCFCLFEHNMLSSSLLPFDGFPTQHANI